MDTCWCHGKATGATVSAIRILGATLQGVEVACNTSYVHAVIASTGLWMLQVGEADVTCRFSATFWNCGAKALQCPHLHAVCSWRW